MFRFGILYLARPPRLSGSGWQAGNATWSDLHHATRNTQLLIRNAQHAIGKRNLGQAAILSEPAVMIANTLHSDIPPRTRLEIVGMRLGLVLTAGVPLLLSFLVPINRLALFECPFLNITGLPGPLCGFTRSILAISAGDWAYATVNNPLAWLFYAVLVCVFTWNSGCVVIGINRKRPFLLNLTQSQANRAAGITIVLILLNWLYRLCAGLA